MISAPNQFREAIAASLPMSGSFWMIRRWWGVLWFYAFSIVTLGGCVAWDAAHRFGWPASAYGPIQTVTVLGGLAGWAYVITGMILVKRQERRA